jgi:tryptophanyl-tRNA synthetase
VVGLHAITVLPRDSKQLREDREDMMASLAALGLGGMGKGRKRATVFFQEDVSDMF